MRILYSHGFCAEFGDFPLLFYLAERKYDFWFSFSLFERLCCTYQMCIYIHYLGAQCEGSSPLLCISYSPTISVMNMLIITSIDFFFSRREAMLFMDDHSQSRVIQI